MNDLAIGKSKLQNALLEVSKNYLANLELAPEETVSYSPRLERKMSCLLKEQRKPYHHLINAPYKKAIAACLAIIIFAGALMSCKPLREPVVEFFANVYEKFTEFFFGEEDKDAASKVITEIHTLTYVPEGYELVESPTLTDKTYEVKTIWKNSIDQKIILHQTVLHLNTTFDTENATIEQISNGIEIYIIEKDKYIRAFWNTQEYAYYLKTFEISKTELLEMINSLE